MKVYIVYFIWGMGMDGLGFGGMNRIGGGMYKYLFFCMMYLLLFLVN